LQQCNAAISTAFYATSEKIIELATNAETLWNSRSDEERLDFVRTILSNQVLDGLNLRYELKKPFHVLAQIKNSDGENK